MPRAASGVRAANGPARIFTGTASTLDPAAQSDVTSASISAQLFETLTTFDADLRLQPALAQSWQVDEGGTRVVFHLRPDLSFSDGTPLRASDVVRSWLRLLDPARPSPLASLMLIVDGATEYLAGGSDASAVGLRADDATGDVTVTLARPGVGLRRTSSRARRSASSRLAPMTRARSRRATASSAAAATSRPRNPGRA